MNLLYSDSILDNLTPGKSQGPGEDGTLKATSEMRRNKALTTDKHGTWHRLIPSRLLVRRN